MNLLMVYPRCPDTFWSFRKVLPFISKKAAYPPLGLLTVASMVPDDWNKRLIDLNVSDLEDEDIQWADMVFISAMLVQKTSAQEVIDRCSDAGVRVVAGGPAFTTNSEAFQRVDHLVLNEAEVTLQPFIEDLESGRAKKFYTDTAKPDLNETPLPMWSLIDQNDYASMAVQYSRGCPFNCEFCDIVIMNGRIPRAKSPQQMIRELDNLYEGGWRGSVFIVDDNFIGNKNKVKEMLPEVIKWQKERKYPFYLSTEASINLADDEELMKMMSEANFYKVFIGLETPSVNSLKECGKFLNASCDLAESVRTIHSNGMQVMGGFIVGFDSDNESIFDNQIRFIQQIGVVTAMVGILTALPQTRLWKRLKEENRLLADSTGENTDGSLNFKPVIDSRVLMEGYRKIISTIYSPSMYYQRIFKFLESYKPTMKSRLTLKHIKVFLLSTWKLGVIDKSRAKYWKLILKTLFTKIKALPTAVELAIFGLHFEQVADMILSSRQPLHQ